MSIRIWNPNCPQCGSPLKIRKGQIYVTCESCGSTLIIEGWEPDVHPSPPTIDEYGMTGTFAYYGDPPRIDFYQDYKK